MNRWEKFTLDEIEWLSGQINYTDEHLTWGEEPEERESRDTIGMELIEEINRRYALKNDQSEEVNDNEDEEE